MRQPRHCCSMKRFHVDNTTIGQLQRAIRYNIPHNMDHCRKVRIGQWREYDHVTCNSNGTGTTDVVTKYFWEGVLNIRLIAE